MCYEIQIHDTDEWHTLGHTPRVMNALSLMASYANHGVNSRVLRQGQTVALAIQPSYGYAPSN